MILEAATTLVTEAEINDYYRGMGDLARELFELETASGGQIACAALVELHS